MAGNFNDDGDGMIIGDELSKIDPVYESMISQVENQTSTF